MEDVLKMLFSGEVRPLETKFTPSEACKKTLDSLEVLEKELTDNLPPALLKTFEEFSLQNLELYYENEQHLFIQGFLLGGKIMMAVLQG